MKCMCAQTRPRFILSSERVTSTTNPMHCTMLVDSPCTSAQPPLSRRTASAFIRALLITFTVQCWLTVAVPQLAHRHRGEQASAGGDDHLVVPIYQPGGPRHGHTASLDLLHQPLHLGFHPGVWPGLQQLRSGHH